MHPSPFFFKLKRKSHPNGRNDNGNQSGSGRLGQFRLRLRPSIQSPPPGRPHRPVRSGAGAGGPLRRKPALSRQIQSIRRIRIPRRNMRRRSGCAGDHHPALAACRPGDPGDGGGHPRVQRRAHRIASRRRGDPILVRQTGRNLPPHRQALHAGRNHLLPPSDHVLPSQER